MVVSNRVSLGDQHAKAGTLAPAALYWVRTCISDPVQPEDLGSAFRRLVDVPLTQGVTDQGVEVEAKVPNDRSWRRVVRKWGDPGYFIGVAAPEPRQYLYCLKDLGVHVDARIDDRLIDLETADVPYGYSCDCRPTGLLFRAPPGSTVKIRFVVKPRSLPTAELIVEPYWAAGTKDRLVGIAMKEHLHLRALTTVLGAVGILAIAFALFLLSRER
jgi:hypothetical protein